MTDAERIAELEKEVAELRQLLHEALARPQYVYQLPGPQPLPNPLYPPFRLPDQPTCQPASVQPTITMPSQIICNVGSVPTPTVQHFGPFA